MFELCCERGIILNPKNQQSCLKQISAIIFLVSSIPVTLALY